MCISKFTPNKRPKTRLKQAIKKHLLQYHTNAEANKILKDSVWTGDPYGWSHNALFTISCEQGLPSACYDNFDSWCKVSEELTDIGLFCEAVNGGVVAVYKI